VTCQVHISRTKTGHCVFKTSHSASKPASTKAHWGVASLIVLVLGIVGVFLFRNAAGKLKLAAFAMITAGLLGVIAFVFVVPSNSRLNQSLPQNDKNNPERTALGKQAAVKLADAERLYFAGRNDQARAAYGDALALYKQVDDRLGQANVLRGLGALNSRKNPKQTARCLFEAAQLYEMTGMTNEHVKRCAKRISFTKDKLC
jgi:hypothetical protein